VTAGGEAWRRARGCVIVRVRVTPKSSVDAIGGIVATAEGSAFQAKVRAVPSEGEANLALRKLLAEWLGVAKSAVDVASGAKSRIKSFSIAGDLDALETRLVERAARSREET
jgi:uncharacterized protein